MDNDKYDITIDEVEDIGEGIGHAATVLAGIGMAVVAVIGIIKLLSGDKGSS